MDGELASGGGHRGAPEGDARDTPPPLALTEGWNIGKPDVTFEMPEDYEVPAGGAIPYTYVILPGKFERDTWLRSAEIRRVLPASVRDYSSQ